MSIYAEYLREKTDDEIIETSEGFATYRYTDHNTIPSVYIVDIYIIPNKRRTHAASAIADSIVELARKNGCLKLLGSVVPSNKNSTDSLRVLLAYGMTLDSSSNDFILFKKDL